MKHTVLVVEDHAASGEALAEYLQGLDYRAVHVKSAEEALRRLEQDEADVVLADLNLPGKDGLWLLEQVQGAGQRIPFVMITGNATIDTAVESIRKGAMDYLSKPVDFKRLDGLLVSAARMRELVLENEMLSQGRRQDATRAMVGSSQAVRNLDALIARVAPSEASVLLLGESGTGKELVANAIVARSGRAGGPYVKVNSAALPKDTLESELFGHVKGAFTGAIRDRKGRFELAHKGTLFLDEIGDMPLPTQVKILRVLQEGEFERVGGSETIHVDVRIIAATNRDVLGLVAGGLFREDLYYRLNVIQIEVPPLRERAEDIPVLANHFLAQFGGEKAKRLDPEAMAALQGYRWPGNIRELRNIMERLNIIVPGDAIGLADLPAEIGRKTLAPPVAEAAGEQGSLDDLERRAILQALRLAGGVKSEAARKLGIGLKTLYRKLERYEEEGVDLGFLKDGGRA